MSRFLKYIIGNSVFMALISNTSLKSLDIHDSLNAVEYLKGAIKIYNFEMPDGVLCEEIIFLKTLEGFNITFSSQNNKFFEEADYYFDSNNNDNVTKQLDNLYLIHKGKRKFHDKMDSMDIHISIRKLRASTLTTLIFKKGD